MTILNGKLFPEVEFLNNLLLDESREAYDSMTKAQRAVVRHAYSYGRCSEKSLQKATETEACPECGLPMNTEYSGISCYCGYMFCF